MKTNFTEAPWKFYGDWGIQPESAKSDNRIFAQFSHDAECEDTKEGYANAHLILAAPKLLSTLVLARKYVDNSLVDIDGEGNEFTSIKSIIDDLLLELQADGVIELDTTK
jgi:hypothetical protein